jgi:hypothetical protein
VARGEHYQEAWTNLPVEPPQELRDPEVTADLLPLRVAVSEPGVLAQLQAWGLGGVAVLGQVSGAELPSPVGVQTLTLHVAAPRADYEFHASLRAMDGTDGPFAFRLWVPDGHGGVAGALRSEVRAPWRNVGIGDATFTSQGDAAAPPAFVGAVHRVQTSNDTMVPWPLSASPPSPSR